jgi:hypothetical protein
MIGKKESTRHALKRFVFEIFKIAWTLRVRCAVQANIFYLNFFKENYALCRVLRFTLNDDVLIKKIREQITHS